MHNKFEINRTKIKGGCLSGRKVVPHDSKSDLPLVVTKTRRTSFTLKTVGISAYFVEECVMSY